MLCTVETAGMNRESKPLQAKDGWSWARLFIFPNQNFPVKTTMASPL